MPIKKSAVGEHGEITPWYFSGSVESSYNSPDLTHFNAEINAPKCFTGYENNAWFLLFFHRNIYNLQSLQGTLILIIRVHQTLSTLNSCFSWTENGQTRNRNLQKTLYSGALQYEGNLRRWNSAHVGFISINSGVYSANIFTWTLWLWSRSQSTEF